MDDLIQKMFYRFFTIVRKDHAYNVITTMQTIMFLIINESDVVRQSLFSILLANRKKGDHGVLLVE